MSIAFEADLYKLHIFVEFAMTKPFMEFSKRDLSKREHFRTILESSTGKCVNVSVISCRDEKMYM